MILSTIAILGMIVFATGSILTAVIVHETEIATTQVTLGSTAIAGLIEYLAKSKAEKRTYSNR